MVLSPEQKRKIYGMIDRNEKIRAIKYIRENFKLSLRDAKELVDIVEADRENDTDYVQRVTISQDREESLKKVSKAKGPPIIFMAIFILAGLGMSAFAFYDASNKMDMMNEWTYLDAEVTGLEYGDDSGAAPSITYEYNGIPYTSIGEIYSSPPSYDVGEKLMVYVNPENPYEILIDTYSEKWFLTTILGGMGLLFTILPIGVMRSMYKPFSYQSKQKMKR